MPVAHFAQMVKDHEETVALFKNKSKQGQDADLKVLATKTLPTPQVHLQRRDEARWAGGRGQAEGVPR